MEMDLAVDGERARKGMARAVRSASSRGRLETEVKFAEPKQRLPHAAQKWLGLLLIDQEGNAGFPRLADSEPDRRLRDRCGHSSSGGHVGAGLQPSHVELG